MPKYDYIAKHDDGRTVRGSVLSDSMGSAIAELALKSLLVSKIAPAGTLDDPIPADFRAAPKGRPIETRKARPTAARSHPAEVAGLQSQPSPPSNPYSARPLEPQPQPTAEAETDQRSYFATSVAGPLVGTVPLSDLQMFFRQFSTMQNAGVPMSKSLETLAKQSRVPKLTSILNETSTATEQGRPISAVLQRYPEVFSALTVSLVRAGEEGGFLVPALNQVADYIATEIEIRNLWRRATLYPKMIIGASILIVLATNAIIASLGKTGGLSSPLTTSSVVVVVVPTLIFLFLYFRVGLANPRIRYNWDAFTLKIPYLGATIHQFAMAKFGRAFGALHKGGLGVGKALRLGADACGNEYLRSKLHPAGDRVEAGDGLAGTLAATGAMDPIVLDMIQTGEVSGNIESMLDRAADHFEEEAKMRSHQLAVVSGVFFLLLVGVYVGYIVVTFFIGMASGLQNANRDIGSLIFPF